MRATFTVTLRTFVNASDSIADVAHKFTATRATRPAAFAACILGLANSVQAGIAGTQPGGLCEIETLFRIARESMGRTGNRAFCESAGKQYSIEIERDFAPSFAHAAATVRQPAQQPQAQALAPIERAHLHVTAFGDDVVPPMINLATPGSEAAHPMARAFRRAFNGHVNLMTPGIVGYAMAGPWACEVSVGEGFRDRVTGQCPEIVGLSVIDFATCRPMGDLSRAMIDRDSARRFIGKLALLAAYRRDRAALLGHARRLRAMIAETDQDASDNTRTLEACRHRLGCLAHNMAGLRCQYHVTLTRFGIETPEPAPAPMVAQPAQQQRGMGLPRDEVAAARQRIQARMAAHRGMTAEYGPMVAQPAQQPQARAWGGFTPAVCAVALAHADLATDEAPLCEGVDAYHEGVREGVDKLTRRGVIDAPVGAAILALYEVPGFSGERA